jgi:hypothetical protein
MRPTLVERPVTGRGPAAAGRHYYLEDSSVLAMDRMP